jgi:hypothetical protein
VCAVVQRGPPRAHQKTVAGTAFATKTRLTQRLRHASAVVPWSVDLVVLRRAGWLFSEAG